MLEGSLDCICPILGKCTISACECSDYCILFEDMYTRIVSSKVYCWYTFNPKPDRIREELQPDWESKLLGQVYRDLINNKAVGDFILVPELTEAGRIHFHALAEITDKVKFYKTFLSRYYWEGIQKPIFNQKPKLGIHYLFKVANMMQDYMGESNCLLTRELSRFNSDSDSAADSED